MARSLLHNGIETCSHARLRNLRTCTSPPSPLQVLPPFCFIGDLPIGFTTAAQAWSGLGSFGSAFTPKQ
ncbi:hypothetical protein PIB30_040172 [Stylosanthes scabra]|uniref:Uncharacterized protein n=1 Tax=Stylosanthes scabra TaxID=79078 RepID=A0ABU6XDN8_9FABA|nr:hypothetical protein [Stylosanthes scabra]